MATFEPLVLASYGEMSDRFAHLIARQRLLGATRAAEISSLVADLGGHEGVIVVGVKGEDDIPGLKEPWPTVERAVLELWEDEGYFIDLRPGRLGAITVAWVEVDSMRGTAPRLDELGGVVFNDATWLDLVDPDELALARKQAPKASAAWDPEEAAMEQSGLLTGAARRGHVLTRIGLLLLGREPSRLLPPARIQLYDTYSAAEDLPDGPLRSRLPACGAWWPDHEAEAREAVLWAVLHRDWADPRPIRVRTEGARVFHLWLPGLPLSTGRPRNPRLIEWSKRFGMGDGSRFEALARRAGWTITHDEAPDIPRNGWEQEGRYAPVRHVRIEAPTSQPRSISSSPTAKPVGPDPSARARSDTSATEGRPEAPLQARVLAALADGPLSRQQLQAHTGCSRSTLRDALTALLKRQQIRTTAADAKALDQRYELA